MLALVATSVIQRVPVTAAWDCGHWYTTECIGKIDKRYNPKSSLDLIDQHPIWRYLDGYYMGDCYDHAGVQDLPTKPEIIDKEPTVAFPGWPYPEFPYAGDFYNLTVDGSRFIIQDISIIDL